MNIFRVPKLLMTIDSRDSRDSASKNFSFLSKKVNELFVDRNANVVTLQYHLKMVLQCGLRLSKTRTSSVLHSLLHRICHQ